MHSFSDARAASAFEFDAGDLPAFIAQLKIRDSLPGIYPASEQYQIRRRWMAGAPVKQFRCDSRTGSELDIQVWTIDESRVGVLPYTDWN
jgi:hypothetical protein